MITSLHSFCILLCICYCFSHLIGLRSVTWLSLLYKFTRYFIYFLVFSDEGPMLETLDYTIRIGSIPTFLYFDLYLFIVSVFVQQGWTKELKSHLFTPLFMFIHLPLIYFAPPPRLLIDFKNSKWLTYFCILLCICYCFSHLIGLRSVTWLSLLYKFTRFFIYFLFLSDEGPMLETLDYAIRIGSIPTILYFDLYLYSAYAAHFVYINWYREAG